MTAARELLSRARPTDGGRLQVDGEELLAEDVRATLRAACADSGAPCPPDVIVASVWNGNGHEPGSGPLPSGLPIVVDLWPRNEASGCWADMTRTFMVGTPTPEHAELIAEHARIVRAAFEQAKAAIRPGDHRAGAVRPHVRPVRVGGSADAANGAAERRGSRLPVLTRARSRPRGP